MCFLHVLCFCSVLKCCTVELISLFVQTVTRNAANERNVYVNKYDGNTFLTNVNYIQNL